MARHNISRRLGSGNQLVYFALAGLAVLFVCTVLLFREGGSTRRVPLPSGADDGNTKATELFVFCAAGMRYPMEQIAAAYEEEYGFPIRLQYGGSNTLLSQLEVSRTGDLYLAADDTYVALARDKGLAAESLPLAYMKPVIAVQRGNPKRIDAVGDLTDADNKVALGNPDAAAVGKKAKKLLSASGHWEALERNVTARGVFKPTVNEVANDIKIGSVDAGIIWDATVAQYEELDLVAVPELDAGQSSVQICVLNSSRVPHRALHFARYVAARDRGLAIFDRFGFNKIVGDVWVEEPEITLFAGAVNRRALDPVIREFEDREGVIINTVYNGCGILTAQMRTMQQNQQSGFPDAYMACDVYYLETVEDWFQDAVQVSDTPIVIAVQKGNPKGIGGLQDLVRPGVRVALGQPEQCTIGVLSKRLLEAEGIYDQVQENNLVTETATSALLVPNITTGSADAVLVYRSDTLAERDKLEVVAVDSPLAQAIQPYSIARSSDFKHLARRLSDHIARSRVHFETAGFHWRLDPPVPAEVEAPVGDHE